MTCYPFLHISNRTPYFCVFRITFIELIMAERLSAFRKDVTAGLYGGDVTRKRKLLEKQKKGKKRMLSKGSVDIPTETYLKVLKR